MNIIDIYIDSASGNRLHCISSAPEGEVKGLVQIVHGMTEYVSRYAGLIGFLNDNGYFVFGHDHIGHGLTAASKEDLGYIPSDKGIDYLVDDTIAVAKHFTSEMTDKPLFIFGHSMGSFVTRCVIAKAGDIYSGAIICGTGYKVAGASAGRWLALQTAKKNGERSYSKLLNSMTFGSYNKRTAGKTSHDWLNTIDSEVDVYLADEFCNFVFTVAGLSVLAGINIRCNKSDCFKSTPANLPIFLIAGKEDPVGDYGKGVESVYKQYKKTNHTDLEIKLYDKARHEIHNEFCKDEVLNDVLIWIQKHNS